MVKKKLAIIGLRGIPAAFPGSSGIDTYVENQLPRLSSNYDVTLYSRSWVHTSSPYRQIPVPCLRHFYLDTGLYTLLATFYALKNHPDVIWYHAPGSALFSFIPRLLGKNVILTLHGIDWQRSKWSHPFNRRTLKLLERLAIHSAHEIQVVSPDLQTYVAANYHRPSLFVPPEINPPKNISPQFLKRYHLEPHQYLLFLGRLVPEKRVDWLIKAFNLLGPSTLKLVIAGSLDHSLYCRRLQEACRHNIIFTDYVSGTHKWALLQYCSLFVLPSSLEGNSVALQEALSLHQPALVADLPPHQFLKKSHASLTLFPHSSFTDFCRQLKRLSTSNP
ncbi:glycosyltransferase family 4 protein [Patescibacteria group bacterium]|nr:glycosyltransferase family 4 protein [Patescibacteria group bacterium]